MEAPGARAARICGIAAIVSALTCVGIPVAIILGIVAIVKSGKARGLARQYPETYAPPSSSGLVLGIVGIAMPVVMLPVVGIVSAIAIPALLAQRARARDKAAISNLVGRMDDLVGQYDKFAQAKPSREEMRTRLEAYLKDATAKDKNPWDAETPACRWALTEGGTTKEDTEQIAREQAMTLGQCVFVFTAPTKAQVGFIGGAVKVQNRVNDDKTVVKSVALE